MRAAIVDGGRAPPRPLWVGCVTRLVVLCATRRLRTYFTDSGSVAAYPLTLCRSVLVHRRQQRS